MSLVVLEFDQLKHCTERLADYTELVFTALHQM